jgi:hypothetical protein
MTSKLYFPGDVRYEKPVSTRPKTLHASTHLDKKTIHLAPLKRKETRSSKQKNQIANPKILFSGIFAGSHYEIKDTKVPIIAVDFDGTIAKLMEPYDPRRAGPPLGQDDSKSMFNKVKHWVRTKKVIILTARMNTKEHTPAQLAYTRKLIGGWTKKYFGVSLPCTAEKHHMMKVMYDDRAIPVSPKTGRIVK